MSKIFRSELNDIEHKRRMYDVARKRSAAANERAEMNARLFVTRPSILLSIFAVGAYKGATTDNPPSRRRQAIVTFLRTTLLNYLY